MSKSNEQSQSQPQPQPADPANEVFAVLERLSQLEAALLVVKEDCKQASSAYTKLYNTRKALESKVQQHRNLLLSLKK